MKHKRLKHRFVDEIPQKLEPGVLYVSIEYGTVIHSCCCGCGTEVVTPLGPKDWKLTYDGESISLWPSVGNWDYPCRSHYIIRGNRVIDAEDWNEDRVKKERKKQLLNRKADSPGKNAPPSEHAPDSKPAASRTEGWFSRFLSLFW